jgi:prepilin peptidase CpaA
MTVAVTWAAVSLLAVVAAAGDVRTGRVPNVLTFGAAAIGLLFAALRAGMGGLGSSVLGYVVGLALFLPLFALGGMGAGDVKLLAAFGAWLGPKGALWTAIWASLVGGVLALVVGAWRGYLAKALRNLAAMIGVWRVAGVSKIPGMTLAESAGPRLAYAVPIGVGALLALWLSVG